MPRLRSMGGITRTEMGISVCTRRMSGGLPVRRGSRRHAIRRIWIKLCRFRAVAKGDCLSPEFSCQILVNSLSVGCEQKSMVVRITHRSVFASPIVCPCYCRGTDPRVPYGQVNGQQSHCCECGINIRLKSTCERTVTNTPCVCLCTAHDNTPGSLDWAVMGVRTVNGKKETKSAGRDVASAVVQVVRICDYRDDGGNKLAVVGYEFAWGNGDFRVDVAGRLGRRERGMGRCARRGVVEGRSPRLGLEG